MNFFSKPALGRRQRRRLSMHADATAFPFSPPSRLFPTRPRLLLPFNAPPPSINQPYET